MVRLAETAIFPILPEPPFPAHCHLSPGTDFQLFAGSNHCLNVFFFFFLLLTGEYIPIDKKDKQIKKWEAHFVKQ